MALEGTLNYLDIAHLLQVVGASLKSGVLEISWEDREARLFFERGNLVRADANRFHEGIGTILVNARLLTEEELEEALARQRSEGGSRRLGAILCEDFKLRPNDIERLLRRQFEQIVFDVFSWPGGRFVFHFQEPSAAADRFRIDAMEFILNVGIQAGLLAAEGVERATSKPEERPLIFLEHDPGLLLSYQQYWRRKGRRVSCFGRVEEVLGSLGTWERSHRAPVLVANLICPRARDRGVLGGVEVVETTRQRHPEVLTLLVGETADPKARLAAHAAGAGAYVKMPRAEDLRGPRGAIHLDVFMIALGRALDMVVDGSAARIPEGGP